MRIKKLLFYQWHSFMNRGIEKALHRLGVEFEVVFLWQKDWEKDEGLSEALFKALDRGGFDAVFSVNFSPVAAEVCRERGLEYISWIYDSPVHIRDLSSMKYETNRIFNFDRGEVARFNSMGIKMMHMPLAADPTDFSPAINGKRGASAAGESDVISMVGRLYKTDYGELSAVLDDFDRGCLEGIIAAQLSVYGAYIIPEVADQTLLDRINETYSKKSGGSFKVSGRELFFLLATETTSRERYLAAKLLSKDFSVEIAGGESDGRLDKVRFLPYVDYYAQMPLCFSDSAVNLNITLKTIRTGVPLRVMDILACGGFCISNMQEEIFELFEVGEEVVVYSDLGDLYEKCGWYLSHPEERKVIAAKGLAAVRERCSFDPRLEGML